jgi:hypothetical protein
LAVLLHFLGHRIHRVAAPWDVAELRHTRSDA